MTAEYFKLRYSCYTCYILLWLLCNIILTHAAMVRIVEKKATPVIREASVKVIVTDTGNDDIQDVNKNEDAVDPNVKFQPLPYPVDFWYYDVNKDGVITIRELTDMTGHAENVQKAFSASDLNGDGRVTEAEYNRKPWGYNPNEFVFQHG